MEDKNHSYHNETGSAIMLQRIYCVTASATVTTDYFDHDVRTKVAKRIYRSIKKR